MDSFIMGVNDSLDSREPHAGALSPILAVKEGSKIRLIKYHEPSCAQYP
jgi:hypothetical protein